MRTLSEIAQALGRRLTDVSYRKVKLAADAGVNFRTLQHVLTGSQDYKVSTLIAVADRLGLELVLVPKDAARAMVTENPAPEVQSRVQAALERLKGPEEE